MALDKEPFKFPDESASKEEEKVEFEVEGESTPEVEIVDDTPPADKGRTPLREAPAEVTEDELAKYTDQKLKDRLAHLGKGYHEERRAKEAAQREKEEALRLAQAVVEENQKLKGSLSQNQQALLEQAKKAVAAEVEDAKRKFTQAYEQGDSAALVAAQEAMTAAKLKSDRINNFRPAPVQPVQNVVQTTPQAPQAPVVDTKTREWQERNSWFGSNKKMTAYALGLHEELVGSGISPSSDEYFNSINADMRKRFPEAFDAEPAEAAPSQRARTNVVAPASRSTAPKKIVLTQTQVNIAKRLGVPLDLYARKVAEEMRK